MASRHAKPIASGMASFIHQWTSRPPSTLLKSRKRLTRNPDLDAAIFAEANVGIVARGGGHAGQREHAVARHPYASSSRASEMSRFG
jgi:hypothetical protein